jgi:DNA-binding response OmpR family regulator
MSRATILVIDDEKDLIELVRYNIEAAGFDVIAAMDGKSGLDIATRHRPNLIVLDLMMPGIDGLEVCRWLRTRPETAAIPVIMLTARASETDQVVGLELGADDYVTKPFSPRELVARVRAILRRIGARDNPADVIRHGDLVVDAGRNEVTYRGQKIDLTAMEFRVLHFLAHRPGRVISRESILEAVSGGSGAVLDRTVDVHVTALRRKLGAGGGEIETVRGFGYKLRG